MNPKPVFNPAACALLGVCSFLTLAARAEPLSLSETVVTATRTAQSAQQSLSAVTVLDRQQIEQSQASSVPELLKKVPGVTLANNGGPGKSTSLFMRGTESDHVLVLVDGIKIGSATSGGAALQDLPLELIERIEVVRGPRSGLYGSEAIGGVVQIFTRKGRDGAPKPYFSAGYGSDNTYTGSLGVSGGQGAAWYSLGLSGAKTDGINVKPETTSGYEADDDGYQNVSASLRAGYRFDNGLELEINVLQARSENEYDSVSRSRTSGFDAHAEGESRVMGVRARYSPLESWEMTLQAGRGEDNSDAYQDDAFYSRFNTRRDSFSWQNDLSLALGHTLTLGVDYQDDRIDSSMDYAEDARDNTGVFLQYLGEQGRHDWQLSLRRDDNEQFGEHDTGNIGYGYALSGALRARVSYGTAFKAPSFNDLYYPNYGSPDVKEETSQSLEVGLTGQHGWGHWEANAFRTEVSDLIAYDSSTGSPGNVDEAVINGVELGVGSQWLGWAWNANYSYMEPENRTQGVNRGKLLVRRAKQVGNLDIDRRFGAFFVGTSLHIEGHRFDDAANSDAKRLAGYATVDLRGEYRLTPQWRVQAKVTNLFDSEYETAMGFNQPGRGAYLSVHYQAL